MITFSESILEKFIVHFVGNPVQEEALTLSESLLDLPTDQHEPVIKYLLNSFKPEGFFHFNTAGNVAYDACKELFDAQGDFIQASVKLAEQLYDVTTHPRILSGDLFVARISKVKLHNEFFDAIVILKAEQEDKFMEVEWLDKHSNLNLSEGYRLDRVDKACLILSEAPSEGYRILVVDKTNGNAAEAQYWTDAFLDLEAVEDSYHHTQTYMHMYKDFVKEQLPEHFEINPAEQIALLNRSSKFFKEKENFEFDNFAEEVIQQPDVVNAFKKFTESYAEGEDHSITENFEINQNAVKKNVGMFKSVLKLDKNFHIYVHGNRNLIERGYDDEKGMNFYKVYFSNETTS